MAGDIIQILHGEEWHWVTVSNIRAEPPSQLIIYDSIQNGRAYRAVQQRYPKVSLGLADVVRQRGAECGLHAITNAAILASFGDPETVKRLYGAEMRARLEKAFVKGDYKLILPW